MRTQHFSSLAGTVALLLGIGSAGAATLSWDPGITGGAALGGATTGEATEWKTSGAGNVWYDGSSNVAWTNGNDATFAGTTGTVYLGSAISAGTLSIASGYTINLRDFTTTGTGYNLTATGISGAGTIANTATGGTQSFTLNIATGSQSWAGTVSGQRINFIKQGAGTLVYSGALNTGATFTGDSVSVQGGTLQFASGASTNQTSFGLTGSGSTMDLNGVNLTSVKSINSSPGTILTSSSGAGTITFNYGGGGGSLFGNVTGSVILAHTTNGTLNLGGTNTFTGGLSLGITSNDNPQTVNVVSDSGLGTGLLNMNNNQTTKASTVNFRSATPSVYALAYSGGGGKNIVLGNPEITVASNALQGRWTSGSNVITLFTGSTGSLVVGQTISDNGSNGIPVGSVITAILSGNQFTISNNATVTKSANTSLGGSASNTNLSVGAGNIDSCFGGVISNASGTAIGSLTKAGSAALYLAGANTYTGETTVTNGTLALISGSGKTFTNTTSWSVGSNVITLSGASNTTGLVVGQEVVGAVAGIPTGAVITEITDATHFKISQNATVAASNKTATAAGAAGSITSTALNVQAGVFDAVTAASLPTFTSLKGAGTIKPGSKTVTLAAGGELAPGNSPGVLTIDGSLDVSGIADTGGLKFELGSPVTDTVLLTTGTLNIGTLNFADFTFSPVTSYTAGSYLLFDTNNVINGSLGVTSGLLAPGVTGTLALADGGKDVVLNIAIPEPASLTLLTLGGLLMLPRRNKKA